MNNAHLRDRKPHNGKVAQIAANNQPEHLRREVEVPRALTNRLPASATMNRTNQFPPYVGQNENFSEPSQYQTPLQAALMATRNQNQPIYEQPYEANSPSLSPGEYSVSLTNGEEVIRTYNQEEVISTISSLIAENDVPLDDIVVLRREVVTFGLQIG